MLPWWEVPDASAPRLTDTESFDCVSDRCAIGNFAQDDRGLTTKGGLWVDLTCKT